MTFFLPFFAETWVFLLVFDELGLKGTIIMKLDLKPNVLCKDEHSLDFDKVAVLIGENGCGKSLILQSIFEQRLAKEAYNDLNVVCFSSGLNENYSESFSEYLSDFHKTGEDINLDCFFFDKSWTKILIFLATAAKENGHVRKFLVRNNYVKSSLDGRLDNSTKLKCKFGFDQEYIEKLKEQQGKATFQNASDFMETLENFVGELFQSGFELESPLEAKSRTIPAKQIPDVEFSYKKGGRGTTATNQTKVGNSSGKNREFGGEISFFTQIIECDNILDKETCKLTFRKGIELDKISDGEFQILFILALIDLFDADNTLFLLDEADSHLHYGNLEELWKHVHSIEGSIITTTHLIDSVTAAENEINHLFVVEEGKVSKGNKIKVLVDRLGVLSRANTVDYEICSKLPNIVLLDDYNDWEIFVALAKKKGLDTSQLENVFAVKRASSYAVINEVFAQGKFDWLRGFWGFDGNVETNNVFLVCDRDEAALKWKDDGVRIEGRNFSEMLKPGVTEDKKLVPHLLVWQRREIKNYLLSYTALSKLGEIDKINNNDIAKSHYLSKKNPGDNDSIQRLRAKEIVDPFINSDEGLDLEMLNKYVDKIPKEEISQDITNMFNYICGSV